MSRTTTTQPQPKTSVRRRRSLLAAAVALAGLGFTAPAQAGTFQVSQCNTVGLTPASPAAISSPDWSNSGAISYFAGCTGDGDGMHVWYENRRLSHSVTANRDLQLPASMANTSIASINVAYTANAQTASTNPAYWSIYSANVALRQHDLSLGTFSSPGVQLATPAGARYVQFGTWCSTVNGPGYCNWSGDAFVLNGLTLNLEENVAPTGDATGSLLASGAQAGTKPLDVTASDADSGVKKLDVTLDGIDVGSMNLAADCKINRFSPCLTSVAKSVDVDTTKVADGSRLVRLVVTDLAGNSRTINKGYITVDNIPAPSNTAAPTISGEKRVGYTLTGTNGTWAGSGVSYAYRWERYAANGWESIPDATNLSHTTTKHENGMRLRLKVTATNSEGSTVAYSDATNPIVAPGPTDTDGDFDGDGIVNASDPDDDNDGVNDGDDVAPYDPSRSTPDREGSKPGVQTPAHPGATSQATLAATFEGSRAKTMRVRYGQKRRITGRLLDATGQPLRGVVLDVTQQLLAHNAKASHVGTVTTESTGRFTYTIPAGPSRKIEVGYKWFKEASSYTHTTAVTVNVVPRVALKVSKTSVRNRQSITFTGKVAGAPRGANKVVQLEGRDGKTWRSFANVRLKRNGSFGYTYRFKSTKRPTRYEFRAAVLAEKGWPFLTGQSRTSKVTVRP